MPFKSEKQKKYFFAHLNSLPKGSAEYNKWKKVVDKFIADKNEAATPMDEIFKSMTSLQEELTEQRKITIKQKNIMKIENYLKSKRNNH